MSRKGFETDRFETSEGALDITFIGHGTLMLDHEGTVVHLDPVSREVVWVYQDGEQFHSTYTSSAQRLPNGNTLICESAGKRVFEVTVEGETVWEYVEGSARSYRYPYDHCPQTVVLGRPKEVSVTPPAELRVTPDGPLS